MRVASQKGSPSPKLNDYSITVVDRDTDKKYIETLRSIDHNYEHSHTQRIEWKMVNTHSTPSKNNT